MGPHKRRAVLIGWPGADWQAIHPLVDAGRMPNLLSLIERGASGNVKSSAPLVPAIAWTSLATGMSADRHGVLSAYERDPLSGSTRPVGSGSRRVKAIWNIANQAGLRTHLVAWPGSHPAEQLNGCCVTDRFTNPTQPYGEPWPVIAGSVHPERLIPEFSALRMHAGELTGPDLRPYIHSLHQIDQEADRRVAAFADTLAQTIATHAISTWLLEHAEWDLLMVGWAGLQRVCELFMRCAAPQLPGTPDADSLHYGTTVQAMYCFYDMLLGRIVSLAGDNATVALVSPMGFRSGKERPVDAALQALPGAWYRPYGMFCIAGPQIAGDRLVHGMTLFDFAPVALNALGLSAGVDMPGKIPAGVFTIPPECARIPSWEHIPGDHGMAEKSSPKEQDLAAEALANLAALGYPVPAFEASNDALSREQLLNTALTHFAGERYAEACQAFVNLNNSTPHAIFKLSIAYCQFRCQQFAACRLTLKNAPTAGLAAAHTKILESYVELAEGNRHQALLLTMAAERMGFERPVVNWLAGQVYARLGDLSRAEEALRNAVRLDPSFEAAQILLAKVLIARGDKTGASAAALKGLSVDYGSAALHSALGVSQALAGDEENALRSFETSLFFDPQFQEAALWAARLAEQRAG